MKLNNYLLLMVIPCVFGCKKEVLNHSVNNFKPKTANYNFVDSARHYSSIFEDFRANNEQFPETQYSLEYAEKMVALALGYDFMEKGDSSLNYVSRSKHTFSFTPEGQYVGGLELCEVYSEIHSLILSKVNGKDSALWHVDVQIINNNFEIELIRILQKTPPVPTACSDLTPWIEGRMFQGIRAGVVANRICGNDGIDMWMINEFEPKDEIPLTGTLDGSPDGNITNSAYASMIWWMNYNTSSSGPGFCWHQLPSGLSVPYMDYLILNDYVANYLELGQLMIDNYYDSNAPSQYKVTDPEFYFYRADVNFVFPSLFVNSQNQQTASFHRLNLFYYHVECTPTER